MPLTPVPGAAELRAFQLGNETTFKTQVAATRRMPWSYLPTTDPGWTFTTNDTGTLDNAVPPYRTALNLTGPATGQLAYNDIPAVLAYGVMGGLSATGGGTAKTWTAAPSSTTVNTFDTATGEWFDDATADAQTYTGGVINDFQLAYPQDLGPVQLTANWRFASIATYPSTPTGALTVDAAPNYVYAADTKVYINDTAGLIGISPFDNQVYDINVSLQNNLDVKRFANGSNARFDVANYGRGNRVLEVTFTFAKATSAVAEMAKFLNATAQERFVSIDTTSVALAQAVTPFQLTVRFSGYWFTRSEQTIGSNTGFQLVCRNRFATAGLNYPFQIKAVTTQATVLAP